MDLDLKIKPSTILTGLAVFGVGVTGFLASENRMTYEELKESLHEESTNKEKAVIFAKSYWSSILAGALTSGCMIGAQVLNLKEIAALTSAVAIVGAKSKEALETLKEKYPDIYNEVIRDTNAKRAKRKIESEKFPMGENGRKPFYDSFSDILFQATDTEILQAECYLNECLFNIGGATLYDYFANFPKECNIELKEWMKYIGWYEGDTSYSYNASYFGSYVKPQIERQNIEIDGVVEDVNVINWFISPDYDPELGTDEEKCIETAMLTGTDI